MIQMCDTVNELHGRWPIQIHTRGDSLNFIFFRRKWNSGGSVTDRIFFRKWIKKIQKYIFIYLKTTASISIGAVRSEEIDSFFLHQSLLYHK